MRVIKNNIVVFGVDVGKESTWVMMDSSPNDILDKNDPYNYTKSLNTISSNSNNYECSTDISQLVGKIRVSLESKKKIALGFEAPMWKYTYTKNKKLSEINVARFVEEEPHHLWYTSAGASSHVMAWSLGFFIFSQLKNLYPNLKVTTNIKEWNEDTIFLYEGFFAGHYKIARDKASKYTGKVVRPKSHLHCWDAFSTAAALFYYIAPNQSKSIKSIKLNNKNKSFKKDLLWYRIAKDLGVVIIDNKTSDILDNECVVLTLK